MRVRRSELTTPGSSRDMLAKAADSGADEVMLDLEDAVAPAEKAAARETVVDAVHEFDWGETTLAVRVNGLHTEYAFRDVLAVVEGAGAAIDTIILPKVRRAADVYALERMLGSLEDDVGIDDPIGVEVLIEETEAMQHVDEIAAASDRLEALIFGPGDYAAAQGVDVDAVGGEGSGYPGDLWHAARNAIVVAARSNDLDAIDGPFADFADPEGYRRECEWSRALGFVGKWAIHPSQVEIANEVYRPSDEAIERAQRIVEAMEAGREEGLGAVQVDGEMIDEATARRARVTLERARAIGLFDRASRQPD